MKCGPLPSNAWRAGIAAALCLTLLPLRPAHAQGEQDQAAVDSLVVQVKAGAHSAHIPIALTIDHARLARQAGSPMPAATVVMVRRPELEARWLKANPDLALELPLRVLIHRPVVGPSAQVSRQSGAALLERHGLSDPSLAAVYDASTSTLLRQVPSVTVHPVPALPTSGNGIVNVSSPLDLQATRQRVLEIIRNQSDTVVFGEITFQSPTDQPQTDQHIRNDGFTTSAMTLILFGGPGPGGRAMSGNTLLGLDAFCQKLLIRSDAHGRVQVRFNDLTWISRRQGIPVSPVLDAINTRLITSFRQGLMLNSSQP